MSNTHVSPSRMTGYADAIQTLVARDGLVCFLCGKKHATVHTMQSDLVKPNVGLELENSVLTCKPCAKRRNGKPLGAYWNERLSAAAAELAHIETVARNKDVVENLRTLLHYAPRITPDTPHAVDGTGSTAANAAKHAAANAKLAAEWNASWADTPHAVDRTGSTGQTPHAALCPTHNRPDAARCG